MVNRGNLKVFWVLLGIFLGGVGTGSAATFAWSHNRMVHMMEHGGWLHNDQRMRALQHTLDLSPEQRTKVAAILEQQSPERRRLMGDVMQRCGETLRDHKAKTDAAIRAILNPEQQARFDKLAKRQAERLFAVPTTAVP